MTSICFHAAKFILSAAQLEHLPPDVGIEIAIAGRSNSGKSTLLNVLCNQKQLARVSKTPGRTQLINVFELNGTCRLIDLPGYGFAKVPLAIKRNWEKTLSQYLEHRKALKGLVLLMDSRHPLKELDLMMIDWAIHSALPIHCVLTKADKLSRSTQMTTLKKITDQLEHLGSQSVSVQLFSALSKTGLQDLEKKMNAWYHQCY